MSKTIFMTIWMIAGIVIYYLIRNLLSEIAYKKRNNKHSKSANINNK